MENPKKCIIELSFNKKILFLFIFPIIFPFERFITRLYVEKSTNYTLFRIFKVFLSYLFSFSLMLIVKYRSKKRHKSPIRENFEENKDNENGELVRISDPIELKIKKNEFKSTRNNILFLVGLSALDFIAYFVNLYEYDRKVVNKIFLNSIGIFFEIINFGLLSFFILKQKYYRHHFLPFGIIIFGLIILFITYVVEKLNFHPIMILYYFFYTLLFSLYDVFGKKYLEAFFESPYYMLFIIGLINSTMLLLYDVIAFHINEDYSGVIKGFRDNVNSFMNFFYFFVELIFEFVSTIGIWLTIYYFTPCHFIISDFISEMIKYYIRVIQRRIGAINNENQDDDDNLIIIIVFTIIYLINIICSLIFNEIIILTIFNLEFYTKKYIKKREFLDSSLLIQSSNNEEESVASSEYSNHS